MDLQSLNTFIQVAELGSFTRAGEKLGFSQPTVSFQIKRLEERMGAPLFERVGHTISLTDAGRDALSYAQHIVRLSEEMTRSRHQRSVARGEIRVAMADSLCTPLLAGEFSRFREKYPQVSLSVTTAGTGELFRLLDHNEVDLVCTLDNPIYNTNYIIAHEEKIAMHFVCGAEDPLAGRRSLTLQELREAPFLLTERGMSYRRMLDEELARHAMEIHPVLEMGSADLLCRLVEEGAGLSFLPDYVTEPSVRAGRLVRLPVEDFALALSRQLLYHRGKWMSLPMEAAIEHFGGIRLGSI